MTTWENIRDARAAAAVAVFAELGVRVDLIHEGSTISSLAACLEAGAAEDGAAWTPAGAEIERIFHLPRQGSFAGAVRPGDFLIYPSGGSERFRISDVSSDAHEAVYVLRARRWAGPVDALPV